MSTRNRILVIAAAVVVVIAAIAGGLYLARPNEEQSPVATAAPSISLSQDPVTPSAEETTSEEVTYECTTATEGFVPVRYTFEGGVEADESIVALGEDEHGNIAAPPPAENRTASWWENGPMPGPTEGKTVLSIHTYRNGGALGNEMYEGGESQMQEGDIIKLYSEDGEVACYEFTGAEKVWVEDYDPDSDMMVDFEGDPELAMIICWDFDGSVDEEAGEDPWESRVFFYGSLV